MERLKFYLAGLLLVAMFAGCSDDKIHIKGMVTAADGDTLYVEHVGLRKITLLDSVKLPASGVYEFVLPSSKYPDFYRLKLNNQQIMFAVDSCETLQISAQGKTFATDYQVENSLNNENIRLLRLSNFEIQNMVADKNAMVSSEAVQAKIEEHKQLARKIILADPKSTAAYFAVNQMVKGYYFFSPYDDADRSFWAAVATAYKLNYQDYERTKELENQVLLGMKYKSDKKDYDEMLQSEAVGCFDVELPDNKGHKVALNQFKGDVVLLDFSLLDVKTSPARILALRNIYQRFEKSNFTIYQVSFDTNKSIWMDKVKNLPWTCVRDAQTTQSPYILMFNLQALPTYFLLNKVGDIVGRFETLEGIEAEIEKLL